MRYVHMYIKMRIMHLWLLLERGSPVCSLPLVQTFQSGVLAGPGFHCVRIGQLQIQHSPNLSRLTRSFVLDIVTTRDVL